MNERKQAKSYTAEFKESAVKLAVESKRPLAQTARELGVSKDTLYGWVRQYYGKPQPRQETVNSEHLYEELKRLRREVSILKEERDILKNFSRGAAGSPFCRTRNLAPAYTILIRMEPHRASVEAQATV